MGIVRMDLLVKGDIRAKRIPVLFDNGSSRSLIRKDIAFELSTPKELIIEREFTVANGHRVRSKYLCD